jgi:hypothetical protein
MSDTTFWLTTAGEYARLGAPRKCSLIAEIRSQYDGGTLLAFAIDLPR